ncbi:MAG TPA: hypothetical protein VNZ45_11280 [Bacteroidia bacterium]|jgi:hypothetical protein|nr:hypothetical protein [Bacteroidia bacterium]
MVDTGMNVTNIIANVGWVAVLGAFLYVGKKLQILDDLTKTSEKIKINVKVIGDHLTRSDTQFDSSELQSYSPLRLTDEGKKLIKDIGFDNVFKAHKDEFYDFIDGENPTLKYDVELSAIKSINVFAGKDYMKFLKVFFYNHPNRSMQNVSPTLGVYIRDKYLNEHPEITE